jgi:hypothetical protein
MQARATEREREREREREGNLKEENSLSTREIMKEKQEVRPRGHPLCLFAISLHFFVALPGLYGGGRRDKSASGATWMAASADVKGVLTAETYYDVLGVPSTSDTAEISRAYRQRCLQLHPDKRLTGSRTDVASDADADVALERVNEANTWLSDSERRRIYDVVYRGKGLDAERKLRESAPTIGNVAQAIVLLAQVADMLLETLAGGRTPCGGILGSSQASSLPSVAGIAEPSRAVCLTPGCGAAVELHGLQCETCFRRPIGKQGRCANFGCLEATDEGETSGICAKCRNKPRKCRTLGCLTMVSVPTGLCDRHAKTATTQAK